MPPPRFSLRAVFVVVFGMACFFGGVAVERRRYTPESVEFAGWSHDPDGLRRRIRIEKVRLPDGTAWERKVTLPAEAD